MSIIKKYKQILFFSLIALLIIYLLDLLGIIKFLKGFVYSLFPLFIGVFISLCMESIISKFIKKGYKRKLICIISYSCLIILIAGAIALFTPLFIKQAKIFINALPEIINKIDSTFSGLDINMGNILDKLQIKIDNIIRYFSNSFSFIVSISIGFSVAFFISYDYDNLKHSIISHIPIIIKEETLFFFSKYIPFFSKYIYSLLVDSVLTFVISFILFEIFGVEYSLIGALIITITNLIPFIGPILSIIPLFLIGYSISTYFAIISLVIVIVVQLLESNLIQPIILNNVIKLHPIEGIVGVLVFSYLFGAIGSIFSPLLVVAFKILFIDKYDKAHVTL